MQSPLGGSPWLQELSGAFKRMTSRLVLSAGWADPEPGITSSPAAPPPSWPIFTQVPGAPVPATPEPSGGFVASWVAPQESALPDLLRQSLLTLHLPLPKVFICFLSLRQKPSKSIALLRVSDVWGGNEPSPSQTSPLPGFPHVNPCLTFIIKNSF